MAGYFTNREPVTTRVNDPKSGKMDRHMEVKRMTGGGAGKIVSGILQAWFDKMLNHNESLKTLEKYLANKNQDNLPPMGYFLTKVSQKSGNLIARCSLKYGEKSPLGKASPRGKTYRDPSMALVLGVWLYDKPATQEEMSNYISQADGTKIVESRNLKNIQHHVLYHDFRTVVFEGDQDMVKDGDIILVRALLMPSNPGWPPLRRVMSLRKDQEWNRYKIFEIIGRMMEKKAGDAEALQRWIKHIESTGIPTKLEEFDKALKGK
jgi:hypothetical protein